MNYVRILAAVLSIFAFGACTRAGNSNQSTLKFQTPSRSKEKITTLAALPDGQKICYGVNVTGPGITNTASSACSLETGLTAGFVAEGDFIEIVVPQGEKRKIELYLFSLKEATATCPSIDDPISTEQLSQIYLVGTVESVDLFKMTETIEIPVVFPGLSQSLAQTLTLPTSCFPTASPTQSTSKFQITTASQSSSAGGIRLIGEAGRATTSGELVGSGLKLIIK